MPVDTRLATTADADSIAAIHIRSWQAAHRGLLRDELLDQLSLPKRREVWRQAFADPQDSGSVFVAVDLENVVGFCVLATPSRDENARDDVAEIAAIYVDPGAWRTGIGRALMNAALADHRRRLGPGHPLGTRREPPGPRLLHAARIQPRRRNKDPRT